MMKKKKRQMMIPNQTNTLLLMSLVYDCFFERRNKSPDAQIVSFFVRKKNISSFLRWWIVKLILIYVIFKSSKQVAPSSIDSLRRQPFGREKRNKTPITCLDFLIPLN